MKRICCINISKLLIIAGILNCMLSCKKQDDWLDVKRQNRMVVPATIHDLQAVLDDDNVMINNYPSIALLGTDDIYMTDDALNGASQTERNSYIWAKDIYQGGTAYGWSSAYKIIEYANIVLDGLSKINKAAVDISKYNNVKGSALFYRSVMFYYLAQLYCKPYDTTTADTDLGLPIRLSSDINIPSVRSTLQDVYDQITTDLKTATDLLPITPLYISRPSRVAANALLAKVYLTMGDYIQAGIYANESLLLDNILLDFNSSFVLPDVGYHFPIFPTAVNPGMIFFASGGGYSSLFGGGYGTANVDTTLYQSYDPNDLRKVYYYMKRDGMIYRGGGYGAYGIFSGLANDEVYLIRAECYARAGNIAAAMKDLNEVLINRYKVGTFVPYTATTSVDALTQILQERRKEFPFSGLIRWEDLRRLNKDPRFATTIIHQYNGKAYKLLPNDPRYVYPIPDREIQLYGLQQNDR